MKILLFSALAGAAAQTCEQCITDPSMQWCYDNPRCLTIGTGCTKSRATCTSKIDCDCSDCANAYLCGQSWLGSTTARSYKAGSNCGTDQSPDPVQTTTEIKRLDNNRASCLLQTNTGSTTAYWAKWTCSSDTGGTLVSQRCSDDECTDCEEFPNTYQVNVIKGRGACLVGEKMDYMLLPPGDATKTSFEDAMPLCLRDITLPTPPPTPPAPTPTPALSCHECVAQDNMQWCWDSSFAAAVGAKGAGKCARPGDGTAGCTVDRSTCSMAIDCACSDCDNSAQCGGPGGKWVGVSKLFNYKPSKSCAESARDPSSPARHITEITRVNDAHRAPNAHCAVGSDIKPDGTEGISQSWKYTCIPVPGQDKDAPKQKYTVESQQCGSVADGCDKCTGPKTTWSVTYTDTGACLHNETQTHDFQFAEPTLTDSGFFAEALAPCFVSPYKPITPSKPHHSSSKVGLGVGLGLGLPAAAGAAYFLHKRRAQHIAAQQGTSLLSTSTSAKDKAELGEMYSQL